MLTYTTHQNQALVLLLLASVTTAASPTRQTNGPTVTCDVKFERPSDPKADVSLSTDSNSTFDSFNIMSPFVAQIGHRWHLYYAGGPEDGMPGYFRYQLGLATAPSPGGPWTKHGTPLLPLGKHDNFHTTPTLLRGAGNTVLREAG